jgi:phosphate starvation-inducible protein PhoH
MGDVRVGDTVVAADGTHSAVVGVYPQGKRPVYRVTFSDGATAECCEEHLWAVFSTDWRETRVITLGEILRLLSLKSYRDRLFIPIASPEQSPDVHLPLDPYLLGVILGNGGLTVSTPRLSSADGETVEAVSRLVGEEGCRLRHLSRYDYSIVGDGGPNTVWQKLLSLGLAYHKSPEKFIPDVYMAGSARQKLELLRGLLDTDGHAGKGGNLSFNSASPVMAKQVMELARSLGCLATMRSRVTTYTHRGERRQGLESYTVFLRHPRPSELVRLTRKRERLLHYQYSSLRRRIESVELVGEMETQCIAIDHPDHLYVTDDYVVTHNTYIACGLAAALLRDGKVERIVLTRPLQECDEEVGTYPGGLREKVDDMMAPMLEALSHSHSPREIEKLRADDRIRVVPLAKMRGHTFRGACVVLDEAQNATRRQLKMFLTRFGAGAKVVVCGDHTQSDLPYEGENSFRRACRRLTGHKDIAVVQLGRKDIVRHPLIQWIDERLSGEEDERGGGRKLPASPGYDVWEGAACPECKAEFFYPAAAADLLVACCHCGTTVELLDRDGNLDPAAIDDAADVETRAERPTCSTGSANSSAA